mmetsp:Transcript_42524/g.78821  ORF Transcript_42524/g.78821 Transcript_42524/m.78821 type:complete len:156 (-) Transcript_42524:244-711(-)
MVVIINGEIVQDNDPRAAKARGGTAGSSGSGARERQFGARIASVVSSSGNDEGAGGNAAGGGGSGSVRAAPPPAGRQGGGPLDQLAEMVGVKGKTVPAPALGDYVAASEVPMIYVIVVVVVSCVLQNWKVPVGAVGLYYLQQYSAANPAGQGRNL